MLRKSVVCIIPLRANSKGLKNKNVLPVCGLPLYMHTVQQAVALNLRTIITTDIPSILQQNQKLFEVQKRDSSLCGDAVPMCDVIEDVIKNRDLKDNTIVLLQATSPLRELDDIVKSIRLFESKKFSLVMSCCQADKAGLKQGIVNGDIFEPVSDPKYTFSNRQELPELLSPNGAVYVFAANDFLVQKGFPIECIGYHKMPAERSIDIDDLRSLTTVREVLEKK